MNFLFKILFIYSFIFKLTNLLDFIWFHMDVLLLLMFWSLDLSQGSCLWKTQKVSEDTHNIYADFFFHFMMHIITFMGWRYSCLKMFLMRSKSTVSKGQFLRLREFNPDWMNVCVAAEEVGSSSWLVAEGAPASALKYIICDQCMNSTIK